MLEGRTSILFLGKAQNLTILNISMSECVAIEYETNA